MTRLVQIDKHVKKLAVHGGVALCKEVRINWLITEVKIPCVAIVCDTVKKYARRYLYLTF